MCNCTFGSFQICEHDKKFELTLGTCERAPDVTKTRRVGVGVWEGTLVTCKDKMARADINEPNQS